MRASIAISWVGYNPFDEATDTREANGNWSVRGHDAAGQLTSVTDPTP